MRVSIFAHGCNIAIKERLQRLDQMRRVVRDEPNAGSNTARIRLQLPNGSKARCRPASCTCGLLGFPCHRVTIRITVLFSLKRV